MQGYIVLASVLENFSNSLVFSMLSFYLSVSSCVFGLRWKIKIILLFSLFLLLFMGSIALFGTIHEPHCIISTNFYLYLQYFQQYVFNFSKINGIQTHHSLLKKIT